MKKHIKKNKLFRKILLTFGSCGLLLGSVACGVQITPDAKTSASIPSRKDSNFKKLTPAQKKGESWSQKIAKTWADPALCVWNADATPDIPSMITTMNSSVHFEFSHSISRMTPYQLGMYLVEMYNKDHGGNVDFRIAYKGQVDNVKINFNEKLKDMILAFGTGQGVQENTPKAPASYSPDKLAMQLAEKIGAGGARGIAGLFKFFGKYMQDAFNMNTKDMMEFFLTNTVDPSNKNQVRLYETLRLLDGLPKQAVQAFPNLLSSFSLMGERFIGSNVAENWATDHNVHDQFQKIDHTLIKAIMSSGN